jgi:hypothetical protein
MALRCVPEIYCVGSFTELGWVQLVLESRSEKYSSMYELKIITIVAGESITTEVKNPYSSWYNQQGYFHSKPFVAFLHNSMLALSRKNPAAARLVSKETANVGNNLDN